LDGRNKECRILVRKPGGKQACQRLGEIWEDKTEMDFRELGCENRFMVVGFVHCLSIHGKSTAT
jgi:hypothetical protein